MSDTSDDDAINFSSDSEAEENESSDEQASVEVSTAAQSPQGDEAVSLTSTPTLSNTDLEADLSIEGLAPNPPQQKNFAEFFLKMVLYPTTDAFIFSNALFDLTVTIATGDQEQLNAISNEFAKLGIPLLAITDCSVSSLVLLKVPGMRVPHLALMSIRNGIGVTNFLVPMTMEFYTVFVELIKHLGLGSEVNMPDWAAGLVIFADFTIGGLQSFNSLFTVLNKQRQEAEANEAPLDDAEVTRCQAITARLQTFINWFNWFCTNHHMRGFLGFFNGAASIHGATMVIENAVAYLLGQSNSNSNLLESGVYFYPRIAATFISGGITAGILGRENAEDRLDTKIVNVVLTIAKLLALTADFASTFFISSDATETYSEAVIQEQALLWVAIPYIPIILLSVQLLRLKGPAMLQALTNMLDSVLEYWRYHQPEVITEDQPLITADPSSPVSTYGSINAEAAANSSYSVARLISQHSRILSTPQLDRTSSRRLDSEIIDISDSDSSDSEPTSGM
jgi:hypothetical protein